jgi:hypothetical protein
MIKTFAVTSYGIKNRRIHISSEKFKNLPRNLFRPRSHFEIYLAAQSL